MKVQRSGRSQVHCREDWGPLQSRKKGRWGERTTKERKMGGKERGKEGRVRGGGERGRDRKRVRKRERITNQADKVPQPSSRLVTLRQVVMFLCWGRSR